MNESAERKRRPDRLVSMFLGGGLALLGIPSWVLLASSLVSLAPSGEWSKYLYIAGISVPILFAVCWKYCAGRKNEIGYLVFGGLITGIALWNFLDFLGSFAPPPG